MTQTAGLTSGATFPVGETTNTFEINDGNGNISTCSFTVTVKDEEAPAITCPGNIVVDAAAVGIRVAEMRHDEHVRAERAPDSVVERLELRPRRRDLHRVAEEARREDRRLPIADRVAMKQPLLRRAFAFVLRAAPRSTGRLCAATAMRKKESIQG